MNIFIGENNLKDYVFLKSIIEKWGIERPKSLKNCDLLIIE